MAVVETTAIFFAYFWQAYIHIISHTIKSSNKVAMKGVFIKMILEDKTTINRYCMGNGYQPYTAKWLEVICKSEDDVNFFHDFFYSGLVERETFDVFHFRLHQLKHRVYSLETFMIELEKNVQMALENLCLCPITESEDDLFCEKIMENIFTVQDFYNLQQRKPKLNFYRLLRTLCNF